MSLINEALRKARQQAAHEQARNRGLAVPSLGGGKQLRLRRRPRLAGAAIAGLLVAVAALTALFVARPRGVESASAALPATPAPTRLQAPEAATVASAEAPAEGSAEAAAPASDATTTPPARPERRVAPPQADLPATARAIAGEASPPPPPAQQRRERTDAGSRPDPSSAEETKVADVDLPEPAPEAEDAEVIAARAADPRPLGSEGEEATAAIDSSTDGNPPSYHREADLAELGTFRLDGIAWSSERPFALVNGEVVGPGGYVDGAQVVRVEPDKVLLALDERRILLRLR